MLFQAAHHNPSDVHWCCEACRKYLLVNPPVTPGVPFHPLPLIKVKRIRMDLVGSLDWSVEGHRFVVVLVD